MTLRKILLPLKLIALVAMVFAQQIETVLLIAGILFILVVIPKVETLIDLVIHSGYVMAPSGEAFKVSKEDRDTAIGQGLRELPIFEAMMLKGEIKKWENVK